MQCSFQKWAGSVGRSINSSLFMATITWYSSTSTALLFTFTNSIHMLTASFTKLHCTKPCSIQHQLPWTVAETQANIFRAKSIVLTIESLMSQWHQTAITPHIAQVEYDVNRRHASHHQTTDSSQSWLKCTRHHTWLHLPYILAYRPTIFGWISTLKLWRSAYIRVMPHSDTLADRVITAWTISIVGH